MTSSARLLSCPSVALYMIGILWSANGWADPVLATLFSDHMVMQQGREIHVWGSADPAEKITATLAGNSRTVTADSRGHWSMHLPAMSAGGPFTLVVHGKREIVVKDVMVGEVWIASGQSNMTFSLDGTENAAVEVPKANYPEIRLFTVPKKIALSPQENILPAHWQICTPGTAKSFSAVGYFFAREIHRKLGVPVGVIESAWPGTAIQEWIAPEVLRSDPDLRSLTEEWDRASPAQKSFAEQTLGFELEFDDFELIASPPKSAHRMLSTFDDASSRLATGGSFAYSWADAPGTMFDLHSPGHGEHGYAARVSGQLDGTNDAILSAAYKDDESPMDLSGYDGIRFWVLGNGSFRFRSKQPTIADYDDYATSVTKASPEWKPVTIWFRDLRQDGWGVVHEFTPNALTGFSIECLTTLGYAPMPVSGLYEGMIVPLLPYPSRGALWYQGESNALQAYQYRKLLPALIQNWRDTSQQKDLEFLIVQLPNHGAIPDQPAESAWAELREAQLKTVEQVPHTGLAVTIDVGDPNDLHPHRKKDVGERLALWALGTTYKQPIEYSGPLYQSMTIEGSQVRLRFTHVGSGLVAQGDGELQGFAIAGPDRKFHWGQARIDGDTVLVSSPDIPHPAAVRYAWGDSPRCNLFNKDRLPASPFRTDDWPGITGIEGGVVALGPIHGYAIAQRIQQISREALQVQQGSLYPALHRLEYKKLLTASWQPSETGREAKFYELTAKGRAHLKAETENWRRLTDVVGLVLKEQWRESHELSAEIIRPRANGDRPGQRTAIPLRVAGCRQGAVRHSRERSPPSHRGSAVWAACSRRSNSACSKPYRSPG